MALVASPTTPFFLDFVDKNGKRASVRFYLNGVVVNPAAAAPAALKTATAALSNLTLATAEVAPFAIETGSVTAGTGPYDRVQDKIELHFRAADGSRVITKLTGPKASDLGSDDFTVDKLDVNMAALIAQILSDCCTADGIDLVGYTGGYKMRPSGQKKH
jgi:hypothetical protein